MSTLTFTIDNSASSLAASSLNFTDNLPTGLSVASPANASSSCTGGALTANPGSGTISYSGGSVSATGICTVRVDITAAAPGSYDNTSGGLTSSRGNSGPATATLTVTNGAPMNTRITIQLRSNDGNISVKFSSSEAALNFTLNAQGGAATVTVDGLPQGVYTLSSEDLTPLGYAVTQIDCDDTDSIGSPAERRLLIELAASEEVICTFVYADVSGLTQRAIGKYVRRRNSFLLRHQPDRGRRLDRLDGVHASSGPMVAAAGLRFENPLAFNATILRDGFTFDANLAQIITSGVGGDLAGSHGTNARWDIWAEGHLAWTAGNEGDRGNFGVLYAGADYLVGDVALIGFMGQIDWLGQGLGTERTTQGTGWMIGPYATLRVAPSLKLDFRAAWGRSTNSIRPLGTHEDRFETERWLVSAALVGDVKVDNWTLRPTASVQYIQDRQSSYIDSLGINIPEQVFRQGLVRLGPTVSYHHRTHRGYLFRPWAEFAADYEFTSGGGSKYTGSHHNGLSGTLRAGLTLATQSGAAFDMSANVSNIGAPGAVTWGGATQLTIPLR